MIRRALFGLAILAAVVVGASSAEARGCRGPAGYYGGGGYYGGVQRAPVYRSAGYRSAGYYGGPSYYHGRGPSVSRRAYYGGQPAYYGRPRSGVTLSFGF